MNFIDLFSGCGGFSEGFYKEGFKSLLHVDFDEASCQSVKHRLSQLKYPIEEIQSSVICGDLTLEQTHLEIESVLYGKQIDVLVGGPPCQSFSTVGRAQDPNSMRNDPRNYLFKRYLDILEKYRPKVFVFENVSGLLTAKPGGNFIFPEIVRNMSKHYDVVDAPDTLLLNSVHYGVPQERKRVILIGVRKDLSFKSKDIYNAIRKTHYSPAMERSGDTSGLKKYRTVKDAISDLPKLQPGQGSNKISFVSKSQNKYLKEVRSSKLEYLLNHVARSHNEKDQERYKILAKHNWQLKDLAEVRPDLVHHDPKHFGNRYTVQRLDLPGKTVVAHLYKDGNLFIHPDSSQNRTFTVREAARVQSFPDDFEFKGSRTNQFKQVGNAVPPLMAKEIARAIKSFIS